MRKIRTTLILSAAVCGSIIVLGALRVHSFGNASKNASSNRLFPFQFDGADRLVIARDGWINVLHRSCASWHFDDDNPSHASPSPDATDTAQAQSMSRLWDLADDTAVQRLLDSLESAPIIETITVRDQSTRGLSRDLFGLASPFATIGVRSGGNAGELAIGAIAPITNQLFVSFAGGGDIFVTSASLLDFIPSDASALRDRALVHFDPKQVDSVEISRPGSEFVRLQRKDGDWSLVLPFHAAADNDAVASLVSSVCSARIIDFTSTLRLASDEEASESMRSQYGLSDDAVNGAPSIRIILRDSSGLEEIVRLGSPVPSAPGAIHALAPDEKTIATVTNTLADLALAPISSLRSHQVFPSKFVSVDALSLRREGQSFSLRRDTGDSRKWHLIRPVEGLADQARISRLLDGILGLRATDIIRYQSPSTNVVDVAADSPVEAWKGANPEEICVVDIAADGRSSRLKVIRSRDHAGIIGLSVADLAGPEDGNAPQELYLIPQTNFPSMLLTPIDLGMLHDPSIWSIDPATITGVTMSFDGSASATIERDHVGAWVRDNGNAISDVAAVDKAINGLSSLAASRVISLKPAIETLPADAADAPAQWMELAIFFGQQENKRKILTVYGTTENGGRSACLRGQDALFELSPETVELLDSLRKAMGSL